MSGHQRLLVVVLLSALATWGASNGPALAPSHRLRVAWHPERPRVGDVAWAHVRGVPDGAVVEGSVAAQPLAFFPYADGQAALVGFDVEAKPGPQPWRLAVLFPGRPPAAHQGRIHLQGREFPLERLSLPPAMVDLDSETEQRALAEAQQLRTLYRVVTPRRLWRGRFVRPVAGTEPPGGFGARRIINGQPRALHTGADYGAPRGTPVIAANDGQVALVAEHFFPGRLVVLDHGLGLYTLYFHLDDVRVANGAGVSRGRVIGTVGATGRATGPHLHFGVQFGPARVDPATLLGLALND